MGNISKHCPICDSTEWDYDVVDGVFIFCGKCYEKLLDTPYFKSTSPVNFSNYLRAIADVRDEVNPK